ncbi:RcnB family protein [Phyllobacterium sp. 21LDTY02-6]|uniref:RcnB family protein n=1 Tax=unclassified Phyllobacterium TaxID=2638441 RepID=UPI0020209CD6|nr:MULTISPECIES: RcnB family protein [unclassified Phyllobacterium]MCO4318639.1 RcnB family protein [Phyllobacterium sp. 21LDTY02-6]MCX8281154.1 RcnB family protein [Phyllobacterium sp. 0TCS1.6C]MCX8294559.1 RcnB family protein [Phyllobacterium sp. 0TCS1.6A]
MKKIALVAIALSLAATPVAFAQQRHDSGRHYGHQQERVVKKRIVTKKVVVKKTRWSRGHKLPSHYRRNVVRDYHRHHLKAPPRGYQWVRADNDYVLIGITSGLISALVQAR